MAIRQPQIPTYREQTLVFSAGAIIDFNRTAKSVTVIDISGALAMRINDGDESTIRAGITFRMPEDLSITKLTFRETAGSTANITIALSAGEVFDSRSNVSGNVPVINAASPNDSLQVDMLAADPGLVALLAGIVANQGSNDLRARIIDLENASYSQNNGGTSTSGTIVTGGANTSGIIVWSATVVRGNTSLASSLNYNDGAAKTFIGMNQAGGTDLIVQLPHPILIPAGASLNYNLAGGATASYNCLYEVL